MIERSDLQDVLFAFASLLTYPDNGIPGVRTAIDTIRKKGEPLTAELLDNFLAETSDLDTGKLEERYTELFDLHPQTHLYAGGHLFYETYLRSGFIVQLKETYAAEDFKLDETEFPDHLAVILKFLAHTSTQELVFDGIRSLLIPVLEKMINPSVFSDSKPLKEQLLLFGETQLKDITVPPLDSLILNANSNPYYHVLRACLNELRTIAQQLHLEVQI